MKHFIKDFYRFLKKFGVNAAISIVKLKLAKQRKPIKIKICWNGKNLELFFRARTTDYVVFNQIFIKEDYNFNVPFEPNYILDAGANNGFSSMFFAHKFPNAIIISIEPDEENYKILLANTKKVQSIVPQNCGLWNSECNLNLVTLDDYNKDAISVKEAENDKDGTIQAKSINSLLIENNILFFDMVKLDVEGSEKKIFAENVEWLKNTRIIIIELHDWLAIDSSNTFFKALIQNKWGFYLLIRGENLICFRDYSDYMRSLKKKF